MIKTTSLLEPAPAIYLQKMKINLLTCAPLTRLIGWVLRVGGSQHSPRTEGAGVTPWISGSSLVYTEGGPPILWYSVTVYVM